MFPNQCQKCSLKDPQTKSLIRFSVLINSKNLLYALLHLGIYHLVSFGFWGQQIPYPQRRACEIRHDLCLSPILLPAQHPPSPYFGSMVQVPFIWSQPISSGNSPAQQPWCLQQSFGLNTFCYRSYYLFLEPLAACLKQAPRLPGATPVQLTCSLHPGGLCLLSPFFLYLHFGYV